MSLTNQNKLISISLMLLLFLPGCSTKETLTTGEIQQWNNPENGTSGTTRVLQKTLQKPQTNIVTKPYRNVLQTVTFQDGTEHQEEIKACQGPNGWEVN